jgi:polysaccharide pyruvyl transferase WcaK-like protein
MGTESRVTDGPPRIGLFGLLGSGNIGNDASMESMVGYLRAAHPDATIDAMCSGPERVRRLYRIEAVPLSWASHNEQQSRSAIVRKVLGKIIDSVRIALWVRRHDAVIVPGMGVLETTLPLRAFGAPYAMFLVSASGKLFGTKIAFVSVGANVVSQRLTRWLYKSAARLAYYRSYRDTASRDAIRPHSSGASDLVYPDLAFGIPVPLDTLGDPRIVGVGVMDFHGTNDERDQAEEIYRWYLAGITSFILWLVDKGREVRLFVGDTKGCDGAVIREIIAHLRLHRPGLEPTRVIAASAESFADLAREMAPTGIVVATRFHNVICALRLGRPTICIGYAAKHTDLMADMGLSAFCQRAQTLDVALLIQQFAELEDRAEQVREMITRRDASHARQLAEQFALLSVALLGAPRTAPPVPSPAEAARAAVEP